jgi:hypothetical protein
MGADVQWLYSPINLEPVEHAIPAWIVAYTYAAHATDRSAIDATAHRLHPC